MKTEQEQYGISPVATAQQEDTKYTIPQLLQILAKAGGYNMILEKK